MLVDAAKGGDVEIPVFCYEPKLGDPVGACRMCLVEVEGIPKLQTACSTPVRDGMVVYTRTDRVDRGAERGRRVPARQPPARLPGLRQGRRVPAPGHRDGLGPGPQPLRPTPSATSASRCRSRRWSRIDRERCILCYRCVRFSQEVAEDEQLQLLERGAQSYVGTFDDRPYIAPFHGNIIELCPVGALTSEAYRFRARPWDIEDAGSICTLCPSQCNVKFTVRDERVERVLARDNHEVDDGWLCDKGRFGFQMIALRGADHRAAGVRRLARRLGARRSTQPPSGCARAGERTRRDRRRPGLERGGLPGPADRPRALGSPHVDARAGELAGRRAARALGARSSAPRSPTSTTPTSILVVGGDPLHEMPILDLRLRKAVRRVGARLVVASERPTALDGGAEETARYAPGEAARVPRGARRASSAPTTRPTATIRIAADAERLARRAAARQDGDRLGRAARPRPRRRRARSRRCSTARARCDADADGAGLIEVPDGANARGLREVGCLPGRRPGLRRRRRRAATSSAIRRRARSTASSTR